VPIYGDDGNDNSFNRGGACQTGSENCDDMLELNGSYSINVTRPTKDKNQVLICGAHGGKINVPVNPFYLIKEGHRGLHTPQTPFHPSAMRPPILFIHTHGIVKT
jgi:hypothetical protein